MTLGPGAATFSANDGALAGIIASASERLVVVAPAVSLKVAHVIAERWRVLGVVATAITLDVDPEVYRLGYGEVAGLELLERVGAELGGMLNCQPGVRIGLIVADRRTVVFAPTPLLIEAGSRSPCSVNALMLGHPAPALEQELGIGPAGVAGQTIGLDKAENSKIATVKEELAKDPPQRFDVARSLRVFNAAVEFVELELIGTFIERKTVELPRELLGLGDSKIREQVRASFRLLGPESKLSGKALQEHRADIEHKYLIVIPKFGTVVLRRDKEQFLGAVEALRQEVKAFSERVSSEVREAIGQQRDRLIDTFLPLVQRNPPDAWKRRDGSALLENQLRPRLERILAHTFGRVDSLAARMTVRMVTKGVTYEMLTNHEFVEAARKVLPEDVQKLHEEFLAARGSEPPTPEGGSLALHAG